MGRGFRMPSLGWVPGTVTMMVGARVRGLRQPSASELSRNPIKKVSPKCALFGGIYNSLGKLSLLLLTCD